MTDSNPIKRLRAGLHPSVAQSLPEVKYVLRTLLRLAGYAVECGLKACIVNRVTAAAGIIFEDRKFSDKCWTHSIDELVKLAGLEATRKSDSAANPAFDGNWTIVQKWSEQARYQTTARNDAQNLLDAITDPLNGVMQWIRVRW